MAPGNFSPYSATLNDPTKTAAREDREMKNNQDVVEPAGDNARFSHAETRTEQAEIRTEEAKTRIEQAEVRIEQAETRTEQAKTRTEQAETRTEQARTRIEQAEARTEQAEMRSEQAIRASELSYRRLFEAAKDGILIFEADTGQISDVNPFLIELLNYSRQELVGKPIRELAAFRDIVSNSSRFAQLQRQEYARYENVTLETRGGRKITVEFVSSVYRAGDRKLIQCNLRDITERKQAEAQILALNGELEQGALQGHRLEAQFIEAQKMEVIGQLASGVAHDFNNILAVIMGYTDFITRQVDAGSRLQKYTEEIQHAAERAVGLTRQLLVFSRKQAVQPIVLDLNDVVNDLEQMLRRLIDENIELTSVPGEQIGRVKADSGYIGQVLMNLVVNARDAMPNGGRLTIATANITLGENDPSAPPEAMAGDYVALSVSDTGEGMTEEVKARLFEPFFTTKPSGKGTGLGLATCQTIARQSGAHIGVSSEIGKGSTFTIFFPRVEQPLDVIARTVQTEPLPGGTETLLVVEDEPSVRYLARSVLEAQGYDVLAAANGHEACHTVSEHKGPPIRLVVSDVIMPRMGGKEMAESLKASSPDLKVLFTSGYTDDVLARDGVRDSGVGFLPKPYTPAALARKVRELLDSGTAV
jgi:PAS domain S-box-containing protein